MKEQPHNTSQQSAQQILSVPGFRPLEMALAYFAVNKNFSYIDRLGNALNLDAIESAVYDTLRDFATACLSGRPREPKQGEVPCPKVDPTELDQAVKKFLGTIKSERRIKRGEHIRVAREVAINALSLSLAMKPVGTGGESETETVGDTYSEEKG